MWLYSLLSRLSLLYRPLRLRNLDVILFLTFALQRHNISSTIVQPKGINAGRSVGIGLYCRRFY